MNEHHVVRGYRFRPLSAERLPVLVSDALGCGPTRTRQPTQSKTGSGDRSSSTPCSVRVIRERSAVQRRLLLINHDQH